MPLDSDGNISDIELLPKHEEHNTNINKISLTHSGNNIDNNDRPMHISISKCTNILNRTNNKADKGVTER